MTKLIIGLMFLALVGPARSADDVTANQITSPSGDLASHKCRWPLQRRGNYLHLVIRKHPNFYLMGINSQKKGEHELAIRNFSEAINICPNDAFAYGKRGMAHQELGQIDAAILDFGRAINLEPEMYWVFNNRGNAYHMRGEYDRAVRDFDDSIRLKPDFAVAFYNRGLVYAHMSEFDRATRDLDRALRLKPDYVRAYNDLAWLLATMPDDQLRNGREAVRLAREAIRLDDDPANHATLAAAYAEAGDFDSAVAEQVRAIEMLQAKGQLDDLADYQSRLDLYQRGQPYRSDKRTEPAS